jgi:hypothetical protein
MALIHGHLKAVHWGAKNTHLLLRSKHIAPKPRIARAPELVIVQTVYQQQLRAEGKELTLEDIIYVEFQPFKADYQH